jgi:hypothetical protein
MPAIFPALATAGASQLIAGGLRHWQGEVLEWVEGHRGMTYWEVSASTAAGADKIQKLFMTVAWAIATRTCLEVVGWQYSRHP